MCPSSHLFKELNIFLRFNFVVVDKGSVGAVKIHDVELDAFPLGFILPEKKANFKKCSFTSHSTTLKEVLPSERNQSVLKNGVLFAAARKKETIKLRGA